MGKAVMQGNSCDVSYFTIRRGQFPVRRIQTHGFEVIGDAEIKILPEAALYRPNTDPRATTQVFHVNGAGEDLLQTLRNS